MADNNIDPELIRELSEKYESMRDAMASMIPAMVLSTTAINQMIAASKGLSVSEKEGKDVVDKFINSIKKTTEENEEQAKITEQNNKKDARIKTLKDAEIASLKQFGSALLTTGDGMAKYGKALGGATSAVGEFISKMGPLGFIIGNLIKGLGFLTEQVFKQNDAMLKSYDSLSEVGATSSLTTEDIRKLGLRAGYTSERLEKFSDITKGLESNLVALGGSASKGVVAFSDVAAIARDQREGFNNLGISQEQVTKTQANYIKQTTAAGMVLAKSPERLRQESLKYIDALVELSALTGISVQKQQEALDIANADENFNQYKAAQSMKRQALLDQAENEQDQVRKKELTAQAEAIKTTLEQKDAYAKLVVSTMSATNAAAALQGISTDGATVYTEANAKLLMAGVDVAKHNREMNAGRSQEVELLESQVKAVRRFTKMFGNSASAYGEYSKELQKEFGVDNKMRLTAAEFEMLKTEEGKKQFLEQRKLNKQEIDAKKAGLGPNDAAKKAQNAQLTAELAAQSALNELTALISGPVTNGFSKLMTGITYFGKVLADMMFKITRGETDLRHLFKTPEELKQDITDIAKEVSKLETELEKENKLRREQNKIKEDLAKKEQEIRDAVKNKAKPEDIYKLQKEANDLKLKERSGSWTKPSEVIEKQLSEKRKELEVAKKRASDAGVPPTTTTTTAPTAPSGPKTLKQLERQQARDTAAAKLGTGIEGKEEDVLSKIKFKNKKEATSGGNADPKLLDIAQKISEAFPGGVVTAMNDLYHQNRKDDKGQRIYSKHMDGKALDFTINPPPENAEASAIIKDQLKDLGASKVLDEYFADKNSQTRGGHFHVEVMKDGGIIQSQPGGTLVQAAEAGMNEAFVPLPKGRNIPVSMPSLDKLTASNKALAEDLRLLVGGNATNNPLVDALSTKLTEKLDPEKLLLNLLSKNIPGVSKAMNMNAVAGVAGNDEMSTTEKLLEVAKLLNPTVRLVSKLFDTYQAISGNEQKQISKLYEAIAPTSIFDQKPIDKKFDQAEITDKKQLDVSITLDKTIEQTSAIPKVAEKPIDQPVVPAQKTTEKPIDQPVVPAQKTTEKPIDQPVVPTQKIAEKPIEAPVTPIPKLTDKTPDFTNIGNGFDKNSYRMAVIDLADIFKTKSNTEMPDVNGLVKSQLEQQQNSQQDLITKLSTAITPTVAPAPTTDTTKEIVELLANKLDTVINKLDTGNNLQEDFNKQSMI